MIAARIFVLSFCSFSGFCKCEKWHRTHTSQQKITCLSNNLRNNEALDFGSATVLIFPVRVEPAGLAQAMIDTVGESSRECVRQSLHAITHALRKVFDAHIHRTHRSSLGNFHLFLTVTSARKTLDILLERANGQRSGRTEERGRNILTTKSSQHTSNAQSLTLHDARSPGRLC